MSLQIEWLGVAEGAVFDSRQALTLVGVNQSIVAINNLPSTWQTAIVILAYDDFSQAADQEKVAADISIQIEDPSGKTVASFSSTVAGERKYKDLPNGIQAIAQVALQVTQYGRYRIRAEISSSGDGNSSRASRFKDIYTVMPPTESQ